MKLLPTLRFDNLRGDIYGGITAGVVALPLALAFGVSSGVGPIAGVYGAIFVGFFAALLGGTPAQVSGPTGPMTVVMAAVFTHFTGMFPDDPASGAVLAFSVVMLGGLFQILFGILRLGKFINLVPHPVISGFMSGIGVIIILIEVAPLLGHAQQSRPLAAAQVIPAALASPGSIATILGVASLAIVYLWPARWNRLLPSPLLALFTGTIGLYLYADGGFVREMVDGHMLTTLAGAPVLGDIPTGFPELVMPRLVFDQAILIDMFQGGLTLAALGSIDSLLTSLVADNMTRSHHQPDRELIGQGIGNTIAGLFGGLPGAGATMRTVVNIRAGGQTPLSGAVHALLLLAIVLGLGTFTRYIPHAVLAGILIKVGTDIIDWDYLRRIRHVPKPGVVMMFTVLAITVFVDLITAVAVGMVMASMVFMKRMSDYQLENIQILSEPTEEGPLDAEENRLLAETSGRVLLFYLSGPMSFGAAKGMVRRLAAFRHYDVLLLDFSGVPMIDFTSTLAVFDMVDGTLARGRQVVIAGVQPKVAEMLEKQGVMQRIDPANRLDSRLAALKRVNTLLAGLKPPSDPETAQR